MDITHDDWCEEEHTAAECQDEREALARKGIFT